jgi:chromosome segregation ATPase
MPTAEESKQNTANETEIVDPKLATPDSAKEKAPEKTSGTQLTNPAALQIELDEARAEAARFRKQFRDLEADKKKQEEEKLAQEKSWQQLADKRKAELDEVAPYKDKYETVLSAVKVTIEERKKQIPEQFHSLIPAFEDPLKTLEWINANAAKLTAPKAPNTIDAGAQGTGGQAASAKLSDAEMEHARKMGVTLEDYVKYRK